uniref:Putative ovule protein n=1 Tax=Solanum chacoense TaxID=4108 RepID=A0A0V0HH42_SOLCH
MQVFAENLGCQVASFPTKYFGMPLGAKNKEVEVWNEVQERYERKLSRLKNQYLSLGGRITLIKSVMDALPTYMMSLFPIPRSIEKKINKSRRVFLWQGNKEKLGYNLVKWDVVTLNKMRGGLGIKKLSMQNVSLLKKWLWRFCSEYLALWRRFISQK